MALQTGNGLMDRVVCADAFIPARSDQLGPNVGGRTAPIQQSPLPAAAPLLGRCLRILQDAGRGAQLFGHVVDQPAKE